MYPFVERELKRVYQDRWHDVARTSFKENRGPVELRGDVVRWDAYTLLTVMWDQWNRVFRDRLGPLERSLVCELREFRNRWAHQARFDFADTYRILDDVERLLLAVSAHEKAERIHRDKIDLLRRRFGEEARTAYKKAQVNRRKWQDLTIYLVCCAALVFVVLQHLGQAAWFLALFIGWVFAYLAYRRTASPPPIYFGPHECGFCGKIIYGETCPYCEPPSDQPHLEGRIESTVNPLAEESSKMAGAAH